jgi:hypothetical protein
MRYSLDYTDTVIFLGIVLDEQGQARRGAYLSPASTRHG